MPQTNFTPPLTDHSTSPNMSSPPWHRIPEKQPTMISSFAICRPKASFSSFLSIVPENDICQGCQAKQLLASLTSSKFTALSGTRPARVSLRSTDDAKETRNNHRGLIGTITVVNAHILEGGCGNLGSSFSSYPSPRPARTVLLELWYISLDPLTCFTVFLGLVFVFIKSPLTCKPITFFGLWTAFETVPFDGNRPDLVHPYGIRHSHSPWDSRIQREMYGIR
jgi:hypothetical protein